jgi:curved DNA-binding protein CbpA
MVVRTLSLDYYQLLNVSATATAEQIEQAYGDRQRQQPRSEFSPPVLAARQGLMQQAYQTLMDPEQRQAYDAQVIEGLTPLELEEPAFLAGLLLLLECGATDLVLSQGEPVLELAEGALVGALAHRESGSALIQQEKIEQGVQQWHQAQALLTPHRRFGGLEREIAERMRRVRPRHILARLQTGNEADRKAAYRQFAEMLEERRGIEGEGQDGSTFNRDQLFQYIQEILPLLEAKDQQVLFVREANRPSLGAAYLAAQVLIARGLALAEPSLVRQAKDYLILLAQRRDVALELAVCDLLLGEVEEAEKTLRQSGDQTALASIERLSAGAPDLLPGLCKYAEDWITQQLFSQTRDLREKPITLQYYFAQPTVQQMLSKEPEPDAPPLPPEPVRRERPERPPVIWPWWIGGVLLGAAGVVALVMLVRSMPLSTPAPPLPITPDPVAVAPVKPAPKPTPIPLNLDLATAQKVIRSWQVAKQAALGEDHDLSGLKQTLAAPLVSQWSQRAQSLAQNKQYWRYRFGELQVLKVEITGAGQGIATVKLQEGGQFYDQGKLNPKRSYQKFYTVRYSFKLADRTWQITDIAL